MADLLSAERLQTLHMVRVHGTLAAAAEQLHLSPSAVSQQLAKLEREAGTALLVPHGRGVRLTAAGEVLAARADRIVAELRAARHDLSGIDGAVAGPVRLGAIPSTVHTFLPGALTSLVAAHPAVAPEITELEPEDGLPMLQAGALDVQIVESWDNLPLPRTPGTVWTPLLDDSASIVVPADHPLADDEHLDAADLADEAWVAWSPRSRANAWLQHTLRERGVEPDVRHTVTGYSTQFGLVAGLRAAALVPAMATAVAPPSTVARPLHPPLHRVVSAVHRTGRLGPAAARAIEELQRAAQEWRASAR
ncbi:LysR family transcriptional regulator [Pseudonocardia phyllosphaerae]|uniref:LysR family transcriptional regulator n=1 Tax=Pseudonocardia phyllosphaerae TaxID=3390502 RepID=UPI0039790048